MPAHALCLPRLHSLHADKVQNMDKNAQKSLIEVLVNNYYIEDILTGIPSGD